jgi:arginine N-succinyltransferase
MDEGFEPETYVDVFDGGPIVDAPLATLRTVAQSRAGPVAWGAPAQGPEAGSWHLVATTRREAFRAVFARARWERGHWCLAADDARRLALQVGADRGARLRAAPLALGPQLDGAPAAEPIGQGEQA